MEGKLDSYIAEHMKKYVKFYLEEGYDMPAIKKCLAKYGYSSKEIDHFSKGIIPEHRKAKKYSQKDLDGETYYYLRSLISDYIQRQVEHGFHKKDIRDALIRYGHKPGIVDDAFAFKESKKPAKISTEGLVGLIIAILVVFTLMLSLLTGASLRDTFLVLSPAYASIVIGFALTPLLGSWKGFSPMISTIIAIVAFLYAFPYMGIENADSEVLVAIDAFLTFAACWFYSARYRAKPKTVKKVSKK